MNPDEIKFVDQPPSRGRGPSARIDEIVAKLKARPGEWALVGEGVGANCPTPYKRRGCEYITRNTRKVDGRRVVDAYARWPEGGE